MNQNDFHSGYCAVIGRPNVGKSTLLNALIGEKLSIISDKPQTTRNRIQMIYTDESMQIVFLDTPGVQRPINKLGEAMLERSRESLDEVDCALFLVDCGPIGGPLDSNIFAMLEGVDIPLILVLNKIDEVTPEEAAEKKAAYEAMNRFEAVIPISAKNHDNLDVLLAKLRELLPEGPMYFPEDMITDRTERFVISEIIREKCLHNLREEIPHGIFVGIDQMKKREGREFYDIDATIYVEKASHKGMVIGKGGKMLGTIGSEARKEIERLIDCRVNLKLWVKIEKDWRKKKKKVDEFGYGM